MKCYRNAVTLAITSLGLLAGVSIAEANLITNGSFEYGSYPGSTPFVTVGPGSNIIDGWSVIGGSIDWINTYWQASDGTKSIDLAGNYQHGLIVGTAFDTVVGQSYRVQFDMAGNPDRPYNKSLVSLSTGDVFTTHSFTFEQAGNTHQDMGWVTQYFDFVATSDSATLFFGDITNEMNPDEAWGAALDNVRVDAVPEPSTVLLLGAGLAAIYFRRRKA